MIKYFAYVKGVGTWMVAAGKTSFRWRLEESKILKILKYHVNRLMAIDVHIYFIVLHFILFTFIVIDTLSIPQFI